MANNLINASELLERINTLWSEHAKLINQANEPLTKYNNLAKLPSNYAKNLQDVVNVNEKLTKSTKELTKTEKQLQAEQKKEVILRNKRIKAFDKYEKSLDREQKLLDRTTGLYNKVQAGINSLTKQYNDLQLRKELGGKLSAEELVTLGKLEAKLNKYQSALKKVDANIGKHQRNVGNYKSGFDGLGFSVAQLSREMPAFANSMQTGFMAISNNIPMLTDEINKLKIANRELAASGKPTVSIFKSLGKAIFSWQTLISVGVTLLTVYGAKLFEAIFPTDKLAEATRKQNEELEEQNKNLRENIALRKRQIESIKGFVNNSQIVDQFKGILTDVMSDSEQAENVLTELAERIGKIGVSDTKDLTNKNILQSDRILMAFNILEIEKQNIKLQEERLDLDAKLKKNTEIENKLKDKSLRKGERQALIREIEVIDLDKTLKIQARINELKEHNIALSQKGVELDGGDGGSGKRAISEAIENQKEYNNVADDSIVGMQKQLSELKQLRDETSHGSIEWNIYNELVKALQYSFDVLTGNVKETKEELQDIDAEMPDFQKNMEESIKKVEKLRQATDDFIRGIATSTLGELGMGSLTTFFDGTFDKLMDGADSLEEKFAVTFNAIGEVAKEAFSIINSASQENFDAQYNRLETQRNVAIQFAGESTTAQAEIERQYERKRAQIQRREAEANKKMALFNIAMSTAQGVVGALAMTPPNIPLSIAIGIIGATQLAIAQGQQIPEFKDGVRNFSGGKAIVGDGGKHEYIRTPDGTVTKTPKTDTLVNLPKGSDVFKDENDFMSTLNKELSINGISPLSNIISRSIMPQITNKGISKEDLREVFSNEVDRLNSTIKNQPQFIQNFNEKGINTLIKKGGQTKVILNSRITGKGQSRG